MYQAIVEYRVCPVGRGFDYEVTLRHGYGAPEWLLASGTTNQRIDAECLAFSAAIAIAEDAAYMARQDARRLNAA